jgi:hypothetical protein
MNIVLLAIMVMCVVFAISFLAWKVKDLEKQLTEERERNRKLWLILATYSVTSDAVKTAIFAAYPDGDE